MVGTCPPTACTCLGAGGPDDAAAYCTTACQQDSDCPSAFVCRETKDKWRLCHKRGFCFPCDNDGQCDGGGKCVKQGSASFCTRPCHPGTTECPRIANCTDVGGGNYQCVHKAGTCVGDGTFCKPCLFDGDCKAGGPCWSYRYSGEHYCGQDCSTQSCPASYTCGSDKQCDIPGDEPSCVKLSPTMEVGDTLDDFAMVGYVDENADRSLADEVQEGA